MNRLVSLLLTSTLLTTQSYACEFNVKSIKKGEIAPCTGYLVSPEQERKFYLLDRDKKLADKEIELKNKAIDLYKANEELYSSIIEKEREKAELWRTRAELSTERLIKLESSQSSYSWVYYAGGILTTVAAGYALGQVNK